MSPPFRARAPDPRALSLARAQRVARRQTVLDANEMLVRMEHRGGCGCDANTGDGAGMLVGMPHEWMRTVAAPEAGIDPAQLRPGMYAVGNIFFPGGDGAKQAAGKAMLERLVAQSRGLRALGWRVVPTENVALGEAALATEPHIEQLFVAVDGQMAAEPDHQAPGDFVHRAFERALFRLVRVATTEAEADPDTYGDFYINSLGAETITYKGQLTTAQVMGHGEGADRVVGYYKDLGDERFTSHMALVHSRFSTNTFPSWDRAQPLRMMCHNGEINTLRGNKNWMSARGGLLASPHFGDETHALLPVVSDNMSDSGNFDGVLNLLTKASHRSLPESVMMMIPEAWQDNHLLSDAKKAFYEYNSCLMEPWDGPAMLAFTDGRYIGATLDRNGLRPSRYYVTDDDTVLLSSEVGVLPWIDEATIKTKARLEPGKMFLCDFATGRIVPDDEVKETVAAARPYADWLGEHRFFLRDWVGAAREATPASIAAPPLPDEQTTLRRLTMFGYTTETMDYLLVPMGVGGKEALGSMGNDAALAVLSEQPRPVFDFFKQLFAQVTNPPIDPIREELVMSLVCPVGPEANLLDMTPEHCARLVVEHPILDLEEMAALKAHAPGRWRAVTIDATFAPGSGADGLRDALTSVCEQAAEAVQGDYGADGAQVIVLSDRLAGPDRLPIPSLLAVGAVHQHLLATKQRTRAALFSEAGDAKEVHDMALMVGFGADGVCPWVAYDAFSRMNEDGLVRAKAGFDIDDADVRYSYRKSLAKGMLKVMSKMGISTLQSYKGAQVFEAVGLDDEVMDRCFTGTASRLGGAGFERLVADIEANHEAAWPGAAAAASVGDNLTHAEIGALRTATLPNPGQLHFRHLGEAHLNTPEAMVQLQLAARTDSRAAFAAYEAAVDEMNARGTLRGQLRLREDQRAEYPPVPLDEVEPAKEIVKRFVTGAMSLGSISREAHETLAVAMNHLGGRSNTGEGGEDPVRFGDNRRSSIKQVASGRFGVTSHYLANADQIQIKMAQGAKPGEGGELPGFKVSDYIAECRGTTPGVGLISPPPHHDIYSIEDLAQLIHDLKCANPPGDVSVKLVSEVGVGVVAAGVAKAKADHIVISGGDGGTGAAAWTGIKGAGLPWELGLAETQQTLVLNNLRSRVKLQTDGQLKTGKDATIAFLLGAEEMAFSTGPLIALGCIMMRKCHLNTCPVGIATQDPELRAKFEGAPEHVINFFFLLAESIRANMAQLGYRSVEEMIGQTHRLDVHEAALARAAGLDLSPLLQPATELNPNHWGIVKNMEQDHGLPAKMDNEILRQAAPAIERGERVVVELDIDNTDRTVGAMLSHAVSVAHGKPGLPDDTIRVRLNGHAGQSLGMTLAPGITIEVVGDANDGVGKSLSGGRIIVAPGDALRARADFVPEEHVVVGNVACYGASRGEAFFRGKAGERFCVRNSGALAVVEGVGDHGCEYMTGGRVVVLGETGRNFAAGMSGGIAYVHDPSGVFPERCNQGLVALERVEDADERAELAAFIARHAELTGSDVAQRMLSRWDESCDEFVKVFPIDYKRVLEEQARRERDEAPIAA